MSYNTRRAGGGAGRGSPQVNYHQAPAQNAAARGREPQQASNPGYNSTQSYATHPAYTSQQGYSSVPKKEPQQQQAPQPPQKPLIQNAPVPPPPATPAPPPPQPPPPPKVEEDDKNSIAPETNGDGKRKPFWSRKGPMFKIPKKIKKRRQNARLRKILIPKNALMVLNELYPGCKFEVQEQTNAIQQSIFSVTVEIEGMRHMGQAMSKINAKQIACENALKAILLTKIDKAVHDPQANQMEAESIPPPSESGAGSGDDSMTGDTGEPGGKVPPEDDVPWGCLASFALHKLFLEWQNQGANVPVAPRPTLLSFPFLNIKKSTADIFQAQSVGPPNPMRKIPDDANTRNPVQMLNQLQPGVQYTEKREGTTPNFVFTISVNIEGQEFLGVSNNKKEAKKECAKAALVKFGIESVHA